MSRLTLIQGLLLVCGLAACAATPAQPLVTDILSVNYRTLDELLPALRPLVPKPGSISGIDNKLVVKTTPENLAEIKRVLARLDRTPRNLMITVQHGLSEDFTAGQQEAFGNIETKDITISAGHAPRGRSGLVISHKDNRNEAGVRIRRTRSQSEDLNMQRLRVLEGRPAFIHTGQSLPFAEGDVFISRGYPTVHGSIRYKDIGTGFYVVPRLREEQVFLDITPQRSRLGGGGAIDFQAAHTTISGRLGEWMELGGLSGEQIRSARGTVYSTRTRGTAEQRIFIKVDEISR